MICYICHAAPCVCGYARSITSPPTLSFVRSTLTIPFVQHFHTFAEAIRVAHAIGRSSGSKVKVRLQDGRWTVTYRYTPVLINGAA